MEDMFNKVKQGAAKAIDEAEKFTKNAVKKTKGAIDQTKLKYTVSEIEDKIKDVLAQMGTVIYNEYKDGAEFNEDISEKCVQLDSFYKDIEEIKVKIAELKNSTVCASCGAMINDEDSFCPKCGVKKSE